MKTVLPMMALAATASAGTMSLDIAKAPASSASTQARRHARYLAARDKTQTVALPNLGDEYIAQVSIGTPAQNVQVQIDTGSSDFFVIADGTEFCADPSNKCGPGYDIDKSNTATKVNSTDISGVVLFNTSFADKTGVSGPFIKEDIVIGDIKIKQQIMGYGTTTSTNLGIMGLAFDALESTNDGVSNITYPSFLDNLVTQGVINKRIFSLFLNSLQANKGSLLFGGVDTERYYDSLVKLPVYPDPETGMIGGWVVKLDAISATGIDLPPLANSTLITLDSGTTDTLLPPAQAEPIFDYLGAIGFKGSTSAFDGKFADCVHTRDNVTFTFELGGRKFYMPISNFVIDQFTDEEQAALKADLGSATKNWSRVCSVGFEAATGDDGPLFGDSFLRALYVVHDVDNQMVGLAQANLQSTKTNVIEISKTDGIPDNKGSPVPTQVVQTGQDGTPKQSGGDKSGAQSSVHVRTTTLFLATIIAGLIVL